MEAKELAIIAAGLLLGIVAHIVKKVIEQRELDHSFSLKRYLVENPYKTFMVLVYAVGGAAGLHMDGSLTLYTAIVTGAAANSFSGKGSG
jgi:hypothetical protein